MSFWDEPNRDALTVAPDMAATPISERSFARSFELANDISVYVLVGMAVAVVVGMMLARATTIVARQRLMNVGGDSPAFALIGLISNLSVLALLLTAFFQTKWYWPILMVILGSIASGFLLNQRNSVRLYKLSAVLGLSIIASTAALIWLIWN